MRLDLSGRWAAAEATGTLRREFVRPELDDSTWARVTVPGHWRDEAAFARSDGPVLYRRRFEAGPLGNGERAWLVMEGAFYETDLWLDGSYLGDTEGYFFPHCFEVSSALSGRREHLLAVEVACPRPPKGLPLLGAWAGRGCVSSSHNPGGIWAPVRLVTSGPVRLVALRAACAEVSRQGAVVELAARLDSSQQTKVDLVTTVKGPGPQQVTRFTRQVHLAAGTNVSRWRTVVPEPQLWWPAGLGGQPLYEVRLALFVGGTESDSGSLPIGLRQARMRDMTWELNGERIFLQGAELAPSGPNLAVVKPQELARDVLAAQEAGLNFLLVKQHVGRPELYQAADEAGMMLWQDLPAPSRWAERAQAVRQAQELAWLLSHHPSIVAWCGGGAGGSLVSRGLLAGWAAERAVKRAVDRTDGSRPALSRLPLLAARLVSPGQRSPTGGPRLARLWRASAIWPAAARFASGVGVAPSAATSRPSRLSELDQGALAAHHGLAKGEVDVVGHRRPSSPSFELANQASEAQAAFVRSLVEGLRLLRFYPLGGFLISPLNDLQECCASSSLLDHERSPGPAWDALKQALVPLLPVASGLATSYRPGARVALGLWAVNSSPQPAGELELLVRLTWPGGGENWRFAGVVPGERTSFVGRKATVLPGPADLASAGPPPWQFLLSLVLLRAGRQVASNYYVRPIEAGDWSSHPAAT